MVNGPAGVALEWDAIDWRLHEDNVGRLRKRIFRAVRDGDLATVKNVQKLMLRSWSNTLISVRQATQRKAGRETAGVDGRLPALPQGRCQHRRGRQKWRRPNRVGGGSARRGQPFLPRSAADRSGQWRLTTKPGVAQGRPRRCPGPRQPAASSRLPPERRLSQELGEQVWQEAGLGTAADIDALQRQVTTLEQQIVELNRTFDERDQELARRPCRQPRTDDWPQRHAGRLSCGASVPCRPARCGRLATCSGYRS